MDYRTGTEKTHRLTHNPATPTPYCCYCDGFSPDRRPGRAATASKRLVLTDDGTLDTVFECMDCGGRERYNYTNAEGFTDGCPGENYEGYLAWATEDAEEQHVCP